MIWVWGTAAEVRGVAGVSMAGDVSAGGRAANSSVMRRCALLPGICRRAAAVGGRALSGAGWLACACVCVGAAATRGLLQVERVGERCAP